MEDDEDKREYRLKYAVGLFFAGGATIGLLALMANFWAEEPWFGWLFLGVWIVFALVLAHYFYVSWFK